MGCDIHLYIEYSPEWTEDRNYYSSFARVSLGRNYTMFGILAGVRNTSVPQLFPQRGVPKNSPEYNYGDYVLYIQDEGEEHCCSRENADRWVKSGSSEYVDDEHKKITHPDWHSASWLTPEEFEECLVQYKLETGEEVPSTYKAALAALKALENSRAVFWFDN